MVAPLITFIAVLGAAAGWFLPQQTGTLRISVVSGGAPVAGADVVAQGSTRLTDASGRVAWTTPVGSIEIVVRKDGFATASVTVIVAGGQEQGVEVTLSKTRAVEEEVTVVASTRTDRRIDDQPMRVEVLNREEVEEKMLMTPGDIVMMLNEMGGLRVQTTSPSLGAASVRIQGMRGRYTRFLSDGLPLFGEAPGGLGLLQIPPMDLGQVEVIKGVASALYGAGAMGGVVNLLSRRPGLEPEHEFLVNRSTRGGTDGVLWLSAPLTPRWGWTLLGGGHAQTETDVDADGWSDLAGYKRGVVRPRVLWNAGDGRSFFATAGFTRETRHGGGAVFRESLDTTSFDAGALGQTLLGGEYIMTARAAFARQRHDHVFGETLERDRHDTAFAEVALRHQSGRHTWVAGVAVEHDRYEPRDVARFQYSFTTPAVFVQDDIDVRPWLALSLSGRVDRHSEYGTFLSPRLSALVRRSGWTARVSAGRGFSAPTGLTEETEAAGLSRLTITAPLRAELGRSVSFDVSRKAGPVSWTATVFSSRIAHPARVDRETFTLSNLDTPTTSRGFELLVVFKRAPFVATGTYTYVRSREGAGAQQQDVPLTPRHSAGLVAMAESERGRVGIEVYLTGRQRLEANPYRDVSEAYVIVGLLAERRIGRVRLFINGENLGNVRQGRWNPVVRTSRSVDGRWTVDAWAPLDGRVVNGGLRFGF